MNKVIDFIKNHLVISIISMVAFIAVISIVLIIVIPKTKANNEADLIGSLEKLGRNYYEDFYYPSVANTDDISQKRDFLKNFNRIGMIIDLEDILRYSNSIDGKEIEFTNKKKKQECDKQKSRVIIYPKDDYGKSDYDIKVELVCGFDD